MFQENVLIRSDGSACIADFGLSTLRDDGRSWTSAIRGAVGSVRYMAKELLDSTDSRPSPLTRKSDIYALGMVILATLTNDKPWPTYIDAGVLAAVSRGNIPDRPRSSNASSYGLVDELWKLLTDCWSCDPDKRPESRHVLEIISNLAASWAKRKRSGTNPVSVFSLYELPFILSQRRS